MHIYCMYIYTWVHVQLIQCKLQYIKVIYKLYTISHHIVFNTCSGRVHMKTAVNHIHIM